MNTIGTLFTGGGIGLATIDKSQIGWGVEYDPAIAEVYATNFGRMPIVARVQDVKPSQLDYVDIIQASPVCKEFSQAKTGGKESAEEFSQATSTMDIVAAIKPKLFLLENVRGYAASKSYHYITVTLLELGYRLQQVIVNFADYGVPQTRIRLVLMAVRADMPTLDFPKATHAEISNTQMGLWQDEGRLAWRGWYEAIEDLIHTLPESSFADWQLARLPNTLLENTMVNNQAWHDNLKCAGNNAPVFPLVSSPSSLQAWRAFLVDTQQSTRKATIREASDPTPTVSVGHASRPSHLRAFLVDGAGNSNFESVTARCEGEPCFTIKANNPKSPTKTWLNTGRVVQMTLRALARFQNIPDTYQLPEKKALACTVIGNGVPSGFWDRFLDKV